MHRREDLRLCTYGSVALGPLVGNTNPWESSILASTDDNVSQLHPCPSAVSNLSQVELHKREDDREDVSLKKRVGLVSGTALIVGTMIGSGIFISTKSLLERTGSVGMSLVVWAACGVLSMMGALSYAELGTMIVKSGAEYSYFLEAFGSLPAFLFSWVSIFVLKPSLLAIICLSFAEYVLQGFIAGCKPPDVAVKLMGALTVGALCYAELGTMIPKSGAEYYYFLFAFARGDKLNRGFTGLPAFVYLWQSLTVTRSSALAIQALTFAQYVVVPFYGNGGCKIDPNADKMIAAACVCLITFLNCYSVRLATFVQNFFTGAKLLAIFIIIVGGAVKLSQGHTEHLTSGFEGTTKSFGDIATAFYSGLWAYDGWNNLNYVTEEIRNPFVNLPRAIILGLPLVTGCYILVNIAYLSAMSVDELLASDAVAVTFGDRVLGVMSWCIPLFVAFSTFGAANGSCFTGGRLCYVAAREGHLVDVLSYVHVTKFTPSAALVFNAIISLLMIIPGDIGSLIDFFSFTAWISYGGAMLALIVMRYTHPDLPRPYKVHIIIPVIVLIISIYLVIAPIVDNPQLEYLYATLFIFAGLIFYIPFVYYKVELTIMNKITTFLQLLLQVVPSEGEPLM